MPEWEPAGGGIQLFELSDCGCWIARIDGTATALHIPFPDPSQDELAELKRDLENAYDRIETLSAACGDIYQINADPRVREILDAVDIPPPPSFAEASVGE